MGSHLGGMFLVHNEVHLEGLLVSHHRSRWGPLLVMSSPWVQVGAVAGDELPPEPFLPWALLRSGQHGALQCWGLGLTKQMLLLPE